MSGGGGGNEVERCVFLVTELYVQSGLNFVGFIFMCLLPGTNCTTDVKFILFLFF